MSRSAIVPGAKRGFMTSETFNKGQKETARLEKKQKQAHRLPERRNSSDKTGYKLQKEEPNSEQPVLRLEPKGKPIYFSRAAMPTEPKRKSAITLYNLKSS